MGIDRGCRQPQGGQAGRGRDRIPRQRAGLIDRTDRGEVLHQLGPAAERRRREAPTHHFAEGHQIGHHPVQAVLPARTHPEAGHHLVADEQRAVLVTELDQKGVEADTVLDPRFDHAHVARSGLGDQRRDLVAVLLERLPDRCPVVVGHDDRVVGGALGHPGSAGQSQGGHTGSGRSEQRVDVTVIAAGELDDLVPAGDAPGQSQHGHGRLGAAVDQPDLLDGRPVDDLGGQLDLDPGRRPVGGAVLSGFGDRGQHLGMGVAEQHRPPRADQVDQLVAVLVVEVGPLGPLDEARGPPDGGKGPDRRVHPARGDLFGPGEELDRTLVVGAVVLDCGRCRHGPTRLRPEPYAAAGPPSIGRSVPGRHRRPFGREHVSERWDDPVMDAADDRRAPDS